MSSPAGAVLYLTRSLRAYAVPDCVDALLPPAGPVLWVRPAPAAADAGDSPPTELAHRLTRRVWADVLAQVAAAERAAWAAPQDAKAAARLATIAERLARVFDWLNAAGGPAELPEGGGESGEPVVASAADVARLMPARPRPAGEALPAHLTGSSRREGVERRRRRKGDAAAERAARAAAAVGAGGAARRSGAGRKSGAGGAAKKSATAAAAGDSGGSLFADQ